MPGGDDIPTSAQQINYHIYCECDYNWGFDTCSVYLYGNGFAQRV